LKQYKRYTIYI